MMICPACNYELLLHNDYCENCGAPAYLVTAAQTADITHCTYCGARDENGSGDCAICGLKKNFKTSESLIGTCRNCGVAWRNVWMYCKTCGVARENGLVDTTLPITVRFQPDGVSTFSRGFQSAYSFNHTPPREQYESMSDSRDAFFTYPNFDPADEAEMPTLLSENEVVERMYANGEEESAVPGKIDLEEFFSESKTADSRRPTAAQEFCQADELAATSAEMAYEFPFVAQHESAVGPSQPDLATIAPVQEPQPLAKMDLQPAPLLPENKPLSALPFDSTTSVATATSKPAVKPTQTIRVINQASTPTTPPIDKKLVKIIVLLIFLVLLFSALIVSGFRLRDPFGKPQSQASPQTETSPQTAVSPSLSPAPPEIPQAP